jgi:hypothetical protein
MEIEPIWPDLPGLPFDWRCGALRLLREDAPPRRIPAEDVDIWWQRMSFTLAM